MTFGMVPVLWCFATSMSDTQHKIKEGIINLVRALNCFEPVLVNEKWNGEFKKRANVEQELPTRDQLVNMASHAMQDIKTFMSQHDDLKKTYETLSLDAKAAYVIAMAANIHTDSLETAMDTAIGKLNQVLDVLTKIGYGGETDLAKLKGTACTAVAQFRPTITPFKPNGTIIPAEREIPDEGGDAGSPPARS